MMEELDFIDLVILLQTPHKQDILVSQLPIGYQTYIVHKLHLQTILRTFYTNVPLLKVLGTNGFQTNNLTGIDQYY